MSVKETERDTKYPIAEDNGEWTVKMSSEKNFGARLKHGLGDHIIFMALPNNAGWHSMGKSYTMLSHQAYAKKIESFFEENGTQFRKISIVSLETGNWQTVWETNEKWRLAE